MGDVGSDTVSNEERTAPPPRTATDLSKWGAIATHFGVDRRTVKGFCRRRVDPLAVYHDHQGVYLPLADADVWKERQRRTFVEAEQLGMFSRDGANDAEKKAS
jgi:hypothetical protein